MTYRIDLVKCETLAVNKWSGGLTTQIAIFPNNCEYGDRDFIWRISSAVVELETSTFTRLDGYDRLLMSLEGKLKLNHEGHHDKVLDAYDVDAFSGSWHTQSEGLVTDFNVIHRSGTKATLFARALTGGAIPVPISEEISGCEKDALTLVVHCPKEPFSVFIDENERVDLKRGDTLLIHISDKKDAPSAVLEGSDACQATAVIAQIAY
ncbi:MULTISPECIES: HutD family protein [unclassified Fusibacter]|uniref:HutD/Ves family protein n=1 Tax=unclassified Fusibacter TaxID=2624464 RepID=UPI001010211D|nr:MULTISPECIES: HutD family protein [unclassified Fusibacter]MCK8060927.1 HutD family protein [Fusibacter sp. A2]NPE23223.1 hypothetical protein [Fusibacter sp. A1]RXV59578.1 hypothetical protein DWB64_15435 [Fusibacter sp. A1]